MLVAGGSYIGQRIADEVVLSFECLVLSWEEKDLREMRRRAVRLLRCYSGQVRSPQESNSRIMDLAQGTAQLVDDFRLIPLEIWNLKLTILFEAARAKKCNGSSVRSS